MSRFHFHSLLSLSILTAPLAAQVPNLVPHQGRVAVNGINFDGTGQFKFALVNAAGNVTYWSNNGSSTAGSQPTAAVPLPVTKGLYSVLLGDTSLTNMTAVPASVYNNADLRLRVWFNNGTLGFQQLSPDQRLAPNGYLPDGAVTGAKLADGAIGSAKLSAGAVTSANLADGAITSLKLAPGAEAPAVKVTGASQAAAPSTSYIVTGSETTSFTLPSSALPGDVINISGSGTAGFTVSNLAGWTPREQVRPWYDVASSADGTRLIAAAYGGQLFTSSDGGSSWVPREQNRRWVAVAASGNGSRLIAAANIDRLYTSADYGSTWTPREQSRQWIAVASSADGMRLIASDNGGHLYTSADAGITWTPREQIRQWRYVASSADGLKLIAGSSGQLYTSTDAGVTWTPREQTRNWIGVASSSDGTRLAACNYGGQLYLSTDAGVNWTPRGPNMGWNDIASSSDGTRLLAGTQLGQLYRSTDSGQTWIPEEQFRDWQGVASSADGGLLFAAARNDRLYTNVRTFDYTASSTMRFTYGATGWVAGTTGGWDTKGTITYRSSGNTGLGTDTPMFPLSFGGGLANTKLALWDDGSGTGAYGMGIQSRQFRFHLDQPLGRFSFLDAPNGNELMTIRGNRGVGISCVNPEALLQVGDRFLPNSTGMIRLASASNNGVNWRTWDIGVPMHNTDSSGKYYSFIIDDINGGNGEPEVTVRYESGFVGIGTASPVAALDVDTRGAGRVQIRNEGNFVPGLNVTGGPLPGYLRFRNAFEIWPNDAGTEPGRMDIRNTAGAPTINMDGGTGRIGIGRSAAVNRLEVEGDASKAVAGAWLANSDRRIKSDIQPVTGALETIAKVNPVTFRYTEDYRKAHPAIADVPYYNVIAQEFREVFPDAVKSSGEKLPDGSEILQVDTYPATITAIAAIKELKSENEALKQRLGALERTIQSLQRRPVNNKP